MSLQGKRQRARDIAAGRVPEYGVGGVPRPALAAVRKTLTRQPMTARQVADATGFTTATVNSWLNQMCYRGEAERVTGEHERPARYRRLGPGKRTLVVEIPAELLDPEWNDHDLRDNAVEYLAHLLYSDRATFEGDDNPYTIDSDIILWTSREDYLADMKGGTEHGQMPVRGLHIPGHRR